ncbi:hypothetical protein [Haloferula sp. A504]|uniref:hypothetical protein n=1 Tax=Haloferula sp. A504 TaxID=3373601 RepID=UPI0031BE8293|nr:hypothetical protein [Verrucomicrobiaceae bacterium E54]
MRPLPTSPESLAPARPSVGAKPATLELGPTQSSNQRRQTCPTQRAYPWLLGVSTLLAGVFCFLYITKPVIGAAAPASGSEDSKSALNAPPAAAADVSSPAGPGEAPTKPSVVAPGALAGEERSPFEETNLRIQHILGATGPQGEDLGRITLDVPVLYESGVVRWTEEDVAKARSLLSRIQQHRQRSREIRDEAVGLIAEWDQLIIESIPERTLRADSPTLPENQGAGTAGDAPLKSTDSIEIDSR